jgi:hypothetical protein
MSIAKPGEVNFGGMRCAVLTNLFAVYRFAGVQRFTARAQQKTARSHQQPRIVEEITVA